MRFVVCLFLAAAAGCGSFALGAILWSTFDPLGAGKLLLVLIFPTFAAMAFFGALGLMGLVLRCDWRQPRRRKRRTHKKPVSLNVTPPQPIPTFDEDLIPAT